MCHKINLIVLLITGLLSGCSSDPEKPVPPPTIVKIRILAAGIVNPDDMDRTSPLVVHVYELSSLGTFEESDFDHLYDNPEEQLGSDLIALEKIHLAPGEAKILVRTPSADTTHIAVIGAYRRIHQATWKDSVSIPRHATTRVLVFADKLNISVWKK